MSSKLIHVEAVTAKWFSGSANSCSLRRKNLQSLNHSQSTMAVIDFYLKAGACVKADGRYQCTSSKSRNSWAPFICSFHKIEFIIAFIRTGIKLIKLIIGWIRVAIFLKFLNFLLPDVFVFAVCLSHSLKWIRMGNCWGRWNIWKFLQSWDCFFFVANNFICCARFWNRTDLLSSSDITWYFTKVIVLLPFLWCSPLNVSTRIKFDRTKLN